MKEVEEKMRFEQLSKKEKAAFEKYQIDLISERNVITTAHIEGKEAGRMLEKLMNNLAVSLNFLKSLPNFSDKQISEMAKAEEDFVAQVRKIVSENSFDEAKELIIKTFFAEIELSEEQREEILGDVEKYYSEK